MFIKIYYYFSFLTGTFVLCVASFGEINRIYIIKSSVYLRWLSTHLSQVCRVTNVLPVTTALVLLTPSCSVHRVTAAVELRLIRRCATTSPASVSTAAPERLDHTARRAPHTSSTMPNVRPVNWVIGASMSTDVVVCICDSRILYCMFWNLDSEQRCVNGYFAAEVYGWRNWINCGLIRYICILTSRLTRLKPRVCATRDPRRPKGL